MLQRWGKLILVLVFLVIAIALPKLISSSFYVNLLSEVMIFGLLAMSIDILAGYTGLTSMGHAGIFGVSSYIIGYMLTKMQAPVYAAVPLGILGSTVTAALFAILATRTTGVYFLMITVAEGMIVWGIAYRWSSVTGAENGIRGIPRPDFIHEYWQFYYLVLVVFMLTAGLMYVLVNSPFGLTLKGIRESESRMRTLGYDTALHKFLGFTATGFFCGIGGALYAMYNGFISPSTVEFAKSAEGVLMVITGGAGTLFGGVLGAVVIIFTRNIVSLFTARWPTVMGIIFVVTILFAPNGLLGAVRGIFDRLVEAQRGRMKPGEEVVAPSKETVPKTEAKVAPEN